MLSMGRRENLQKLIEDVEADIEELREASNLEGSDEFVTITSRLAGRLIGGVRDATGILRTNLDLISPPGT